jgi:hypothetical protein
MPQSSVFRLAKPAREPRSSPPVGIVLVDSTHPNLFKGKGNIDNWPTWIRLPFLWYLASTAKEELDLVNTAGDEVLNLQFFIVKAVIVLSVLRPMEEKIHDSGRCKRKANRCR